MTEFVFVAAVLIASYMYIKCYYESLGDVNLFAGVYSEDHGRYSLHEQELHEDVRHHLEA